ncbi:hypothetical protein UF75_3345 [Desulfosporosinus sp. I2]|uniref:hypothetical protein n=1 Tax=Desulfosporosinus sp. I2 TaxID=1617025 RepID=UPI0005EEF051|nr:hypothetical protein [Desulfosporosinus sp. I2]KJR46259.1 hypothetical protein UF75_3345 [Desulfosporosinus sp. I2]
MKKPTIIVIDLVLAIIVICSIGIYASESKLPAVSNEVIQNATSKSISKNGLEDWTITMTPILGTSIQYNGNSEIQDVMIKFSTGITLKVPTLQPKSPIESQGKSTFYIGKVNVNIEWVDKGQKHSGSITFQIDSVK